MPLSSVVGNHSWQSVARRTAKRCPADQLKRTGLGKDAAQSAWN